MYFLVLVVNIFTIHLLSSLLYANSFSPKNIEVIEYGSNIMKDITLSGDSLIYFAPRNNEHSTNSTTMQGSITLLGGINTIFMQDTILEGNINIGIDYSRTGVTTTTGFFYGAESMIHGSIQMGAENSMLYYGRNFIITENISLIGIQNTLVFDDGAYISAGGGISIGNWNGLSNNSIRFGNGIRFAPNVKLYMTGNTTIDIGNIADFNSSALYFSGGDIRINMLYAQDISAFLQFEPEAGSGHEAIRSLHLTFGKGFVYKGDILIPEDTAQRASEHTLTIAGANILGNIQLPAHWSVFIDWETGTKFVGKISQGSIIIAEGFAGGIISAKPLQDGYALRLTEKSVWNGDIEGTALSLAIIDSTVDGAVVLKNPRSVLLDSSTIKKGISFSNTTKYMDITITNSTIGAGEKNAIRLDDTDEKISFIDSKILGNITIDDTSTLEAKFKHTIVHGDIVGNIDSQFIDSMLYGSIYNGSAVSFTNSVLYGDITTSREIQFINSSLYGSIDNGNTVSFTNSLVSGNVNGGASSAVVLKNSTFAGNHIDADTITLIDGIYFSSETDRRIQSEYSLRAQTIELCTTKDTKRPYLFSAYNGTVGDNIFLEGNIWEKHAKEGVFFIGDIDFISTTGDTIDISKTQFNTLSRRVVAFSLTEELGDMREEKRIENVLVGFKEQPILITESVGGYNIALEENIYAPYNYDIVLQGYSPSNHAFAGVSVVEGIHRKTLWDTIEQKLLASMMRKQERNEETGRTHSSLSVWGTTVVQGGRMYEEQLSQMDSLLSNSFLGFLIEGLPISSSIYTNINLFMNYGFSKTISRYNSVKNSMFSMDTLVFGAESAWNFQYTPNKHHFFLSAMLTGEMNFVTMYRKGTTVEDKWNYFSTTFGMHFGYVYTMNRFSLSPYMGLRYGYTQDSSNLYNDFTKVDIAERNQIFASLGMAVEYTFPIGLKPYFTVGVEKSIFDSTKGVATVAGRNVGYTTDNFIGDIALGMEYTGEVLNNEIFTTIECAVQTDIETFTAIYPSITLTFGMRF